MGCLNYPGSRRRVVAVVVSVCLLGTLSFIFLFFYFYVKTKSKLFSDAIVVVVVVSP